MFLDKDAVDSVDNEDFIMYSWKLYWPIFAFMHSSKIESLV